MDVKVDAPRYFALALSIPVMVAGAVTALVGVDKGGRELGPACFIGGCVLLGSGCIGVCLAILMAEIAAVAGTPGNAHDAAGSVEVPTL